MKLLKLERKLRIFTCKIIKQDLQFAGAELIKLTKSSKSSMITHSGTGKSILSIGGWNDQIFKGFYT